MCVARFGVLPQTSPKFYQNFIFPLELSRLRALHCSRRERGKEHSENIEQNRKGYKNEFGQESVLCSGLVSRAGRILVSHTKEKGEITMTTYVNVNLKKIHVRKSETYGLFLEPGDSAEWRVLFLVTDQSLSPIQGQIMYMSDECRRSRCL